MEDAINLVRVVTGNGQCAVEWAAENKTVVAEALADRGGLLLRGFKAADVDVAERVLDALGVTLLTDAYWSTPRSGVAKKTFTATEYASARSISLHSEMSYMRVWPRLVAFHALVAAEVGGQTTLCDIDAVSAALGGGLADFADKGVLYQRTHHQSLDIPWRKAYQTDDPKEAERIARDAGMEVEWFDGDILQTRHRAQGCIADENDRPLYFNQSNLFHTANLPPGAEGQLTALLGAGRLPRSAYYGDGSPIPDELVLGVNAAFNERMAGVSWRPGDVLILDNLRLAHGRAPFKGARKLHVALAHAHSEPKRTPIEWPA